MASPESDKQAAAPTPKRVPVVHKRTKKTYEEKHFPILSVVAILVALLAAFSQWYHNERLAQMRTRTEDVRTLWGRDGFEVPYEQFRILKTPAETGGEFLQLLQTVPAKVDGFYHRKPGSPVNHLHYHEDEDYEVVEGTLTLLMNGQNATYATGETVRVPKGTAHYFWNAEEAERLVVKLTLTPPGPLGVAFFENVAGLQRDGCTSPWQMVTLMTYGGMGVGDVPAPFRFMVEYLLAPLWCHVFGVHPVYPVYSLLK